METTNSGRGHTPEGMRRLCAALSCEHNRRTLEYFQESPGDVASVDELATYVADYQNGGGSDSPEQIALRLHHVGLPKLAGAGVLEYDPRSKTVRYRDHPLVEGNEVKVAW